MNYLFAATVFNCFSFFYNFHKTKGTLLGLMEISTARICLGADCVKYFSMDCTAVPSNPCSEGSHSVYYRSTGKKPSPVL
jgi:hypothetical protein